MGRSADSRRDDDSLEAEARQPGDAAVEGAEDTEAEDVTLAQDSTSHGARADTGLTTVEREHYLIEGEIARGGMGRVLAARDRRLGRPVALKELLTASPELAQRFEREALMTARLQHPSIVNVYEAGRWPSGEPFYAMKRVVGRPLDQVVRETRSLDERLALLPTVLAVAEALSYAHEQGVIHRDLKPANILVGAFGETVVVDWGLAKDLLRDGGFGESAEARASEEQRPDGLTVVGTVLGTPAFMAPEQARGEPLDERADVYALGAILYTVLAGAPPYVAPSSTAVLQDVLKGPPPPLEQRQAGLPEDLLALVRKAMSPQREGRYRTARELTEDLRRYQTGQLVGAHRYSAGQLVVRWLRKHRAAVAVASAAVLALALFGAFAVRRIQAERDEARARNDELILAQARSNLETDPTAALAWLKHYSPEGPKWGAVRMIAADARSRGIARLTLPGHDSSVRDLAFSPDGKHLASVGNDYALRLWDVKTGAGRLLFRSDWHARSVEFSPDGQRIAFAHGESRAGLWDFRTGTLDPSASGADGVERVWLTGDGRGLLLLSQVLQCWNLATRAYRFRSESLQQEGNAPELALTPERKHAATRNDKGEVRRWDLETGTSEVVWPAMQGGSGGDGITWWRGRIAAGRGAEIWLEGPPNHAPEVLRGHSGPVRALAVSPDGALLASGGADWTVRLWSVEGRPARVLRGHRGEVAHLVFSPDGRTLASQTEGGDDRILLWDVSTGAYRALCGETQKPFAFSPDGTTLATSNRGIRLWSSAREDTEELPAADDASSNGSVAVSPSGRLLATGAGDRQPLRLWQLTEKTSRVLVAWNGWLSALTFSPGERALAAAGGDGVVRVWSLPDLTLRELRGHHDAVDSLAFSPDSKELASGSRDNTIRLWNLATGTSRVLQGHDSWLDRVTYSPDGTHLASATQPMKFGSRAQPDKDVHVWDQATGQLRLLKGHTDTVSWVDFSPDGRFLASASMDHTVRIWNLATGQSQVLRGHGDVLFQVAFTRGGDRLVSTSNDDTTRVWDIATGSSRALPGGGFGLALSPDGQTICHYERLWDIASGEGRSLRPEGWVGQPVFSPRGGLIVARTATGGLRLWREDTPSDPKALRHWLDEATNQTVDAATGAARR
jgi:WD40 repeat protein